MSVTIPYRQFSLPDGSKIHWVFLNVQLSLPSKSSKGTSARTLDASCIIDSGATNCLFEASLAEELGLDLKSGQRQMMNGIGGLEEVWFHRIVLHVPGGPVPVTAGFKQDLPVSGLLGLNGFFEHFLITFDPALKRCTLDRIHQA